MRCYLGMHLLNELYHEMIKTGKPIITKKYSPGSLKAIKNWVKSLEANAKRSNSPSLFKYTFSDDSLTVEFVAKPEDNEYDKELVMNVIKSFGDIIRTQLTKDQLTIKE